MKVLVVDDSKTMRQILQNVLQMLGVDEIVQASDGVQAVEAAATGNFNLVLMDWNMPNMSGIEALIAIRAKGIDTPIVMVTTEAEKDRVIDALKNGANDYMVKPFTPIALEAKLKRFLE